MLLTAGAVLLSGCGAGVLAGPSDTAGFHISGHVHGGAYPIQNATISLMQTRSNGAWNATTNSYVGTAKQLLTTTSDSTGYFTFPDTFTCAANQYVYIEVSGGHTTATTNNNVIQLGVVGSCSGDLNSTDKIDKVNVFISELSTVAAAYALNNFISIPTNSTVVSITSSANNNAATPQCTGTGTNMACTHAGLAHAFANAYNLVDSVRYDGSFPTGAARTANPNNSQSTVPQALINTLGNILQSCVDSDGGTVATFSSYSPGGTGSTHCGDLFYYATPPGSTTPPTTTLQAILNIAAYPSNNVDALFNLQPRAVFFTPDLSSDKFFGNTSQLISYTISIFYSGTGLPNDAGLPYPVDVALDASDDAFVVYSGSSNGTTYGAVDEFAANGLGLMAGTHQSSIPNPSQIAIDSNANVWLTNDASSNGNIFQIGSLGAITNTITVPNGYAAGLAFDLSGNFWLARDSAANQSIYRFDAASPHTAAAFTTAPSLGLPSKRLFVDKNQNILGVTSDTDPTNNSISTANAVVWRLPYASGGTGAALGTATLAAKNGFGITMSSTNYAYMPLYQQLDTENLNGSGVITANQLGSYTAATSPGNVTYSVPMGVSMDGAGVLYWSDFEAAGQIFKFSMTNPPSASAGTLTSFFPCYSANGYCLGGASNLRGMAIDSSGAMWYIADSTAGTVIQTLGFAAPTYPLVQFASAGVIP